MKSSYKYLLHYYLNHRWLRNPFDRTYVRINQSKFIIPIAKGIGLANIRLEEKWMDKLLGLILPEIRENHFLDVGVNLGQTLLKVKSITPQINYIGFEPNPKCVNYVNELININAIENATLIPAGISDKTEILDLLQYDNSGVDASASLVEGFRSNSKKREPVVVLEPTRIKVLANIKIGCIKIDVEGSELEVLQGFAKFIIRDCPVIICEILPCHNNENKSRIYRQKEVVKLLKSLNYRIYRINVDTFEMCYLTDIEIHSSMNLCNYVFLHKNSEFVSNLFSAG